MAPVNPQAGIFTLDWPSILDSILTAAFLAVLVALVGVVQTPGFNLFTADWGQIISNMVNVGVIAIIGVLAKNFASNNTGSFLGKTNSPWSSN